MATSIQHQSISTIESLSLQ